MAKKSDKAITIGSNIPNGQVGVEDLTGNSVQTAEDLEKISFNYKEMGTNFDKIGKEVQTKLTNASNKLNSLLLKEDILNKMIFTTNALMEKTPAENYKLVGTYQNILMKQFESLTMWQEAVMKYEDLIQRYLKMKIDIENHKLSNFSKIKNLYKAKVEADEGFDSLMRTIHQFTQDGAIIDTNASGAISAGPNKTVNPLEEAKNQLRISGY
jgi:hypothetical protein